MNGKIKIINIHKNNLSEYTPRCFMDSKNEGCKIKIEWLKKRFSEGLVIKQLYSDESNSCNGFIEYVPGENAWRTVDAKGYMFIHCLWIYPNKMKNKGNGSLLIKECIKDAKNLGCIGVAVVTSTGAFMADKDVFLKNGFRSIEKSDKLELLVLSFKKGNLPKFKDWQKKLKNYSGLNIVYSNQCPWVAKSIKSLSTIAKSKKLDLNLTELKTPKHAQNAPSVYSVFSLIHDGKLLEDHYISDTRFKNIIKRFL